MWGKKEKAAAILAKYHGGGDMNHPMVQLELREFEAGIELQKSSSVFNYWGLVDTPNARWRFLMMTFMSIFAQLSGNSVLTYYLPSMYKLLGVKTPERKLLLTFANTIVSGAGAVAGSALNDAVGRRTKLWIGSIILAGLFGGVTGFSSHFEGGKTDVSATITNGGIAFVSSQIILLYEIVLICILDLPLWMRLLLHLHASHSYVLRRGSLHAHASQGHGYCKLHPFSPINPSLIP